MDNRGSCTLNSACANHVSNRIVVASDILSGDTHATEDCLRFSSVMISGDEVYQEGYFTVDVNIFVLVKAFLSIESMTHKKLQKLCYYAKAWYLALYDENIIPESFQAWVHGAVNPELYHAYKDYGFDKIPQVRDVSDIPEDVLAFAKDIFDVYGKYTGDQLEYINLMEEPWIKARNGFQPWESCSSVIPEEDMKIYYRSRIKDGKR